MKLHLPEGWYGLPEARVEEIPYQPGLTAIVGPNGSGKTTILTALLLALHGEADDVGVKQTAMKAGARDVWSGDSLAVHLEDTPPYRPYKPLHFWLSVLASSRSTQLDAFTPDYLPSWKKRASLLAGLRGVEGKLRTLSAGARGGWVDLTDPPIAGHLAALEGEKAKLRTLIQSIEDARAAELDCPEFDRALPCFSHLTATFVSGDGLRIRNETGAFVLPSGAQRVAAGLSLACAFDSGPIFVLPDRAFDVWTLDTWSRWAKEHGVMLVAPSLESQGLHLFSNIRGLYIGRDILENTP